MMRVYVNGKPTITETNLAYALPYWERRKQLGKTNGVRITWEITWEITEGTR